MKKIISLFLIVIFLLALMACSGGGSYRIRPAYQNVHGSHWRSYDRYDRRPIIIVPPGGMDRPEAVQLPEPPAGGPGGGFDIGGPDIDLGDID